MIRLNINSGVNEIDNGAGVQITGNHDPEMPNGMSPRELIEAAIALCTSITLEAVLKRDGIEYNPDEVSVVVEASKQGDVKNQFTHFDVKLTLPKGLDEAYTQKLLKVVERGCTISNTVSKGATVTLQTV